MNIAPILLFCFKRVDTLKATIDALKKNTLATESDLFVFSDAAKFELDSTAVNTVRKYLKTVTGFKSIKVFELEENKGLATSIISGVTQIIDIYKRVIVLEDDLQTTPNFLSFKNQALDFYINNPNVFSISGFTMPVKGLEGHDIYFTKRASSWGWATWKDRWNPIDWNVNDYEEFMNNKVTRTNFNKMGSDMSSMLTRQMTGNINSWAIRWCYHQFKQDLYTVYPATSKVLNIGLENPDATHTNERFNRFKTTLDTSGNEVFNFSDSVKLDDKIIQQFIKPYSISERIKYKILNSFFNK